MMWINDNALLVHCQHVHVEPFPAQRSDLEHRIGYRIGLRGHENVPFFQDGRETVDVYVFGIDQNLAGPKRQYGGIDVHRIGTAALDLMNAITIAKVATQPFNTGRIGDVAADHEQVAPAAKEIGGVEDRFEFSQDI